jgi:hypothetical protein
VFFVCFGLACHAELLQSSSSKLMHLCPCKHRIHDIASQEAGPNCESVSGWHVMLGYFQLPSRVKIRRCVVVTS